MIKIRFHIDELHPCSFTSQTLGLLFSSELFWGRGSYFDRISLGSGGGRMDTYSKPDACLDFPICFHYIATAAGIFKLKTLKTVSLKSSRLGFSITRVP